MPPAEFEPEIAASKRPQTHALDSAATGIGSEDIYLHWTELALDLEEGLCFLERGDQPFGSIISVSTLFFTLQ
jgi:hypothetical protein